MDQLVKDVKHEGPDPPMTDPGSYCWFCFSVENLISISSAPSDFQKHIVNLLDGLTDVKLNVDDPSAICGMCLFNLNEYNSFGWKYSIYNDVAERLHDDGITLASPENIKTEKHVELTKASPESDNVENVKVGGSNLQLASYTKESPNVKAQLLSSIRTGQTGPLMRKLNKLRGVKHKKPKSRSSEQTVNRSLVADTKESSSNKTPQFTTIKTGRTGPLMQKLNKLRGINTKKPKSDSSEDTDYRCRLCLQFFVDKESMSFHLKTHLDSDNLRCRNCSRTFYTLQGLMSHALRSYILTTFFCQHCDVPFKSKEELVVHELYCEQDISKYVTSEVPKAYQCSLCPKSYDKEPTLQSHMLLHDVHLVCVKCGTDFHTELNLKKHIERYHSKGADEIASVVTCELCQRTFVDASAYRNHHTGFHQQKHGPLSRKLDEDKLYQCDHCGKRFWSINTIRYHVLVHRHYRDCDQCSESYRSQQELRDHKLAAHPVHCPYCPKKFFAKKSCRAHASKKHRMVQIKLLAKDGSVTYEWRNLEFKCGSCEQDYEYYRELSDHNAKMHPGGKIQIKCSFCERHISSSRIGYLGHVTSNCGQTPKKVKAWH